MKWLKSTPFNQKEEQQRVGRRETKEFQHICSQMICLHYRQRIKDYIDENCKEKPFLRVHHLENAKKLTCFSDFTAQNARMEMSKNITRKRSYLNSRSISKNRKQLHQINISYTEIKTKRKSSSTRKITFLEFSLKSY